VVHRLRPHKKAGAPSEGYQVVTEPRGVLRSIRLIFNLRSSLMRFRSRSEAVDPAERKNFLAAVGGQAAWHHDGVGLGVTGGLSHKLRVVVVDRDAAHESLAGPAMVEGAADHVEPSAFDG